jgi:hypothetical protein
VQEPVVAEAVGHDPACGAAPGVVGREESDERGDEGGGIDVAAAERAGEGPQDRVPGPFEDRLARGVPLGGPPGAVARKCPVRGEVDGPIEGEPAHQMGVRVVCSPAADLPDGVVGPVPTARREVGEAVQHGLRGGALHVHVVIAV